MIQLALIAAVMGAEHRFAVSIGHNHGDVDEPPLMYAQSDAQRFADVLESVGSVPSRNLVELMDPDADQVEGALDRLATELNGLPEQDQVLVFVFYSGHADATALHLGGSRLGLEALVQRVEDLPADARVLVLDACRSGELTVRKGGVGIEPFDITVETRSDHEGLAIITSAAAGEDAQESDLLRGGVFSHHLIAGLRGAADVDGNGAVTLSESFRYASDRTLATTSQVAELQHPSFRYELSGSTDLIVTRPLDTSQLGRVQAVKPGHYLLFDVRGRELFVEAQVDAGGTIAVPPGAYLVRRHSPDRVQETKLEVTAGQTQTIEGLQAISMGQATRRRGAERTALAVHAGGGLVGPMLNLQSWGPAAELGLRVDTRWMSIGGALRGSRSQNDNDYVVQTQTALEGELSLLRLLDVGRVSLGPEVHAGFGGITQSYATDGIAPTASAPAGTVGLGARVEWAPMARAFLALEGGADLIFAPVETNHDEVTLGPHVAPRVTLELGAWVF